MDCKLCMRTAVNCLSLSMFVFFFNNTTSLLSSVRMQSNAFVFVLSNVRKGSKKSEDLLE